MPHTHCASLPAPLTAPRSGLAPFEPTLPRAVDALWTVGHADAGQPQLQRTVPEDRALDGLPAHPDRPQSELERRQCERELTKEQLGRLVVGPKTLDFGTVCISGSASRSVLFVNPLDVYVHVVMDVQSPQELRKSPNASQVGGGGRRGASGGVARNSQWLNGCSTWVTICSQRGFSRSPSLSYYTPHQGRSPPFHTIPQTKAEAPPFHTIPHTKAPHEVSCVSSSQPVPASRLPPATPHSSLLPPSARPQVIPPFGRARFPLLFHALEVRSVAEKLEYCINSCHVLSLGVTADVVPVSLEPSAEDLHFQFPADNWDSAINKVWMCVWGGGGRGGMCGGMLDSSSKLLRACAPHFLALLHSPPPPSRRPSRSTTPTSSPSSTPSSAAAPPSASRPPAASSSRRPPPRRSCAGRRRWTARRAAGHRRAAWC